MKFTKINDNSIRCIISRQEMDAAGVKLDDLMDDRGKAEEFLRFVLQEARDEIGFRATGDSLNVQLSVMQDGDLSLMISDDTNAAIHAMIQQFKEKLKDFSEILSGGSPDAKPYEPVDFGEEERRRQIEQALGILERAADNEPILMTIWAELESLDDCVTLSHSLSHLGDIPSDLYTYNDRYYMHLSMTQVKREIAHNVFTVAEHSNAIFNDDTISGIMAEHGRALLTEHALVDLQEI
ncbi:MAG: adaptor protein MecA [Lachnospiraceae bacterium]|nr:adaptor protein MecA [Lachnospiraceae bacterium]